MFDLAFNLISQTGDRTCGQVCIAMLSKITEIEACKIVGHCKGTKTREIVKALKKLKIKCAPRLSVLSKNKSLPKLAILKVIHKDNKKRNWHWVVICNNVIYDPLGYAVDLKYKNNPWSKTRKVTSFLEIHSDA